MQITHERGFMKVEIKYRKQGTPKLYSVTYDADSLAAAECQIWLNFYHGNLEFRPVEVDNVNILQIVCATVKNERKKPELTEEQRKAKSEAMKARRQAGWGGNHVKQA